MWEVEKRRSQLEWRGVRLRRRLRTVAGWEQTELGSVAAAFLVRLLRSFVFGISVLDPFTFALVPLVTLLLAGLATWLPASRCWLKPEILE